MILKYWLIKGSLSPLLLVFAWKHNSHASPTSALLPCQGWGFPDHVDACSFWGRPFIALLHGHNFNLFKSSRAGFRGEGKYIRDNSFPPRLNWTVVWVRQCSNWFRFFSPLKESSDCILQQFAKQKSASSARRLWFLYIWLPLGDGAARRVPHSPHHSRQSIQERPLSKVVQAPFAILLSPESAISSQIGKLLQEKSSIRG